MLSKSNKRNHNKELSMKTQKITLNIKKTINQNASDYFEKAKKSKKKLKRTQEEIQKNKERLEKLEKEKPEEKNIKQQIKKTTKKEWYEKFRWFISSENFLCIGGRDATTNEIIVKKHTQPEEIVFHTENPGSPFFVIKDSDKKKVTEKTLKEVAITTCSFSKAWRQRISTTEVYYIKGKQISKQTKAREYLKKGSFIITGKRNYLHPEIQLTIGITEKGKIMTAAKNATQKHCKKHLNIIPGKTKTSEIAKKIAKKLNYKDLDEIIRRLPPGTTEIE